MPVHCEVNDEEGWEGAFFQFEADDPEYVMEFQRSLNPSQAEVRTGENKVAVVYYGATVYGGIRGWELVEADEIKLTQSPEAARTLDTDPETTIVVEGVSDLTEIYNQVRGMLERTGEWDQISS